MSDIWIISDTHFGHENTCTKFKRKDGTPLRPFPSAKVMDEVMVEKWNALIKPQDHVYHLGDVLINKKNFPTLGLLNGHKRVVLGNHDIFPIDRYIEFFEKVYGARVWEKQGIIFSHIPLALSNLVDRGWVNIHGHLHANDIEDGHYVNVSVEHTDYAPIHFDELLKRIKEKREKYPYENPTHASGTP